MPYPEWWLRHGWYELGLVEFAPVLVLAGTGLVVAAALRLLRGSRERRGRGILLSLPLIAWALFVCRQALNATQYDIVRGYTRYPHFWSCILASALVGLVVFAVTIFTNRLLAATGSYRRPAVGVVVSSIVALAVWITVWVGVFAHEASLAAKVS
jgi:hypothetical protein